jgi:hypothetical protein
MWQDLALRLLWTLTDHEYRLALRKPVAPRSLELIIALSGSTEDEDKALMRSAQRLPALSIPPLSAPLSRSIVI